MWYAAVEVRMHECSRMYSVYNSVLYDSSSCLCIMDTAVDTTVFPSDVNGIQFVDLCGVIWYISGSISDCLHNWSVCQ